MDAVIDANVVCGYYKEAILGKANDLTGPVTPIFDRLGNEDTAYIDEGGQVESEWRRVVENEWFEIWFTDSIRDGLIKRIGVETCRDLFVKLTVLGFPASRDRWHIRVAKKVAESTNLCVLLTEDLDFYDPKKKLGSSKTRTSILLGEAGPVSAHLRRHEGIVVSCAVNYLGHCT